MARETSPARSARVGAILARLRDAYPDAHCELNYANPLQLLVATVLSAQCTDRQVNVVTADLFPKYPTADHFAEAPLPQLEADLRRIGLFRGKARNIQAAARLLLQRHAGEVPGSLNALVALPGVGRKTANVVLGNAFGCPEGVVVDTHVARVSRRLRLTRHTDPVKIEQDLNALVPREQWSMTSHWLIWHGRRRCGARQPDCPGCELAAWCPSAGQAGTGKDR